MKISFFVFLIAGVLSAGNVLAFEEQSSTLSQNIPTLGEEAGIIDGFKAKAMGNLVVRESPPSAWRFYFPGEKVGVLWKDSEVTVEEVREVSDFFSSRTWLKIRSENGSIHGWVYNGMIDRKIQYLMRAPIQ